FELLFTSYSAMVRHHLQRMVRDIAAAEDLVQEVFLRVWQHAEQWQGSGTLNAWLLRIATNLALNHLRTIRRRHEQPLSPDEVVSDLPPTSRWRLDHTLMPPDMVVEQAEQQRLIGEWIAALPAEQRAAFRLVQTADMDRRTIAEVLGIPEGTVKSRLHYAIRKLIQHGRDMASNWEEENL